MTTTGLMCLSKHGNMFLFGESGDSACNECLTNQPTNWEKTLKVTFSLGAHGTGWPSTYFSSSPMWTRQPLTGCLKWLRKGWRVKLKGGNSSARYISERTSQLAAWADLIAELWRHFVSARGLPRCRLDYALQIGNWMEVLESLPCTMFPELFWYNSVLVNVTFPEGLVIPTINWKVGSICNRWWINVSLGCCLSYLSIDICFNWLHRTNHWMMAIDNIKLCNTVPNLPYQNPTKYLQ